MDASEPTRWPGNGMVDEPVQGRSDAPTLRVVVADAHTSARRALADTLDREPDLAVIPGVGASGPAIELARHYRPDVVLVDADLPLAGGIATTRQIIAGAPESNVLLRSSSDDVAFQLEAVAAGAAGVLPKGLDPARLPRILRKVAAGEGAVSRMATRQLIDLVHRTVAERARMRPVSSSLTTREWEVLDLLTTGANTKAIADRLVLSTDTVYSHVKRVLRKLGVHSRAEAVWKAEEMRRGAVEAPRNGNRGPGVSGHGQRIG